MNVDVRAHRAAADAHAATPHPDIRLTFADLQYLARRRRATRAASLVVLALAVVVAGGLLVTNSDQGGTTTPMSPQPTLPSAPPTPTDWSALEGRSTSLVPGRFWEDPYDTTIGGIDLTQVYYRPHRYGSQPTWSLGLASKPPLAPDLKPGMVISYGVVVDSTHDGIADYLIGINDNAPQATIRKYLQQESKTGEVVRVPRGFKRTGAYRVWVTDLATGQIRKQVGPPYGYPIDFAHPDEQKHGGPTSMLFYFLQAHPDMDPVQARFYAWSCVSRDGEVIAWDTAPDTGWMNGPRAGSESDTSP